VGTPEGRVEVGTGAGGDRTLEIDAVAERTAIAILERVAARGERFSLLSEEVGQRDFGAPSPLVLMDPIDGSLNAKQGLPVYGLMLSLLEGGATLDRVSAGYVLNLVSGESWQATRAGGALRDGRPLVVLPVARPDRIEVLGLESSPRSLARAQGLVARSSKVRILGSMALSIAHAAAGGFDVFCSAINARVFDMSASLLIASEAGATATDLEGRPLARISVEFESRTTLLVAADPASHRLALEALRT
jgi:myo-inositol-1(or 4)-monophosphatase